MTTREYLALLDRYLTARQELAVATRERFPTGRWCKLGGWPVQIVGQGVDPDFVTVAPSGRPVPVSGLSLEGEAP